jgi:hypothetical protein
MFGDEMFSMNVSYNTKKNWNGTLYVMIINKYSEREKKIYIYITTNLFFFFNFFFKKKLTNISFKFRE